MKKIVFDREKLVNRRKALKLTYEKLAELSGVNQGGIQRLEAGKRTNPKIETLGKLALALRVSVSYFLKEVDEAENED